MSQMPKDSKIADMDFSISAIFYYTASFGGE